MQHSEELRIEPFSIMPMIYSEALSLSVWYSCTQLGDREAISIDTGRKGASNISIVLGFGFFIRRRYFNVFLKNLK